MTINYDILNQPEHRGKILHELEGLVNIQGWLYLCQILDYNIYIIEQQILNEELSVDEAKDLKKDRKRLIQLKEFPNKIIMKLTKNPKGEALTADPYE